MKKQVFNPYLPNYEYIPDGEPHVFNNRLYIFGSHDRFGSAFFCGNDYVTWSAPVDDLSDWTYHGFIFYRNQDPFNRNGKYVLFAPDVAQGPDGRYYLFYAPCGTKTIGVAVCDIPDGHYQFLSHVHDEYSLLGLRDYDPYPFDPAVFVDDDGSIYLYIGFYPEMDYDWMADEFGTWPHKPGAFVIKLESDMHTIKEDARQIIITDCPDHGHQFFEAPSLRKINDRYYFIYSSNNSHELCYGISDNPLGPFEYKGILHDNGDIGLVDPNKRVMYTGNNHGSLVEVNGKWYIFGHRPTNYSVYARQGVAEPVTIDENGFIPQAEMTSCGLNDGPLVPKGRYGTYIACHLQSATGALHYLDNCDGPEFEGVRDNHPVLTQDGEDREDNPGQYIKNMRDGSIAGFKYFQYTAKLAVKVSTRKDAGIMEIRTSPEGDVLGVIRLSADDDFHDSETVIIKPEPKEKLALYFTYKGPGSVDFNEFELESA